MGAKLMVAARPQVSEIIRVIEFAILFGLGFLSAALLVTLAAPAVYRRVVAYAERRLKATMPMSPQEVRAQKDMARALYAAENAKARQELETEREKSMSLSLRNDTISTDASRIVAESRSIKLQIEEMIVEAGDLRSKLRRHEESAEKLKTKLDTTEDQSQKKTAEINTLTKRIGQVSRQLDELKIAKAALDLEVDQARQRVNSWRNERDTMAKEVEEASSRNRDAANHMSRESRKIHRLEEQLAKETSRNADNETLLERRSQEISRLKERLSAVNTRADDMVIRLPQTAAVKKVASESAIVHTADGEATAAPLIQIGTALTSPDKIAKEIENIRNQGMALTERLLNVKGSENDEAIRKEIAMIAARMIVLTATQEGEGSSLPALIAKAETAPGVQRQSLAGLAAELMAQDAAK
jgi:chromosome segregation ATPase